MLTRRQFGKTALSCITGATLFDFRSALQLPPGPLKTGAILTPELKPKPAPVGILIQLAPPGVPAAASAADNSGNISNWGVMLNDQIGDCVVACMGHTVEAWTKLTLGTPVVVPNTDILSAYRQITGYNPNTGQNDTGMPISTGLDYWKKDGIGGHKLTDYRRFLAASLDHIRTVISIFGVCIAGMVVNDKMIQAVQLNQPWAGDFGAAGNGHCIPLVKYDPNSVICVTWGVLQRMDWAFYSKYVKEAYIPFGPEMFGPNQKSFSGYTASEIKIIAENVPVSEWIV